MGASHIASAYTRWAGRVPPLSMVLLTYMALVAKDANSEPWYSQGHQALAELALGRPAPLTTADLRAVERAITPLLRAGAIVPNRRASVRRDGHSTVRYLLVINDHTEAHARRFASGDKSDGPDESPVDNPLQDSQRPTDSDTHARRNPTARPTETVTTPDGNRGTEEKEEPVEEREEEEIVDLETAVTVSRANGAANKPKIDSPSQPTTGPPARASPPPKPGRCPHHVAQPAGMVRGRPRCQVCRAQGRTPDPPQLRVLPGGAA